MSSISINAQLQSLLDGFAAQTGGSTTTAYQRIYNAITASPELTSQLNAGAASGALTRIVFIAQGREVSAGYYQSGGIYIGAEFLNPRDRPPRSQNDLIFALGHEVRHMANAAGVNADLLRWEENIEVAPVV